jgi:hypothetical protein
MMDRLIEHEVGAMRQVRIDMRSYRKIGCSCFGVFTLCTIFAVTAGQYGASLYFVGFALIGLFLALCYGTYVIDADGLSLNSVLGHWQISWDEVSAAQFSSIGAMVLLGGDKRFLLASPSWWPKACRSEGVRFVSEQLRLRNIQPVTSALAEYKWMKNTRVKRGQGRRKREGWE